MAEKDSREREKAPGRGELRSKLVTSFLTPIAAAAASAAAGYAAKRAPAFVEQKVLPRLRSLAGDAGGATHDLPVRAKSVASGAGEVAQELGERAKSIVSSGGRSRRELSPVEIARRQDQRARSRAERRKARAR